MAKKIIAFLIALGIVVVNLNSMAITPYETEITEDKVPYTLLEKIGIINNDEYPTIESVVSRGDFLKWALRISGMPDNLIPEADKQIFVDVAVDNKYADIAQYAYEHNIVKGTQFGLLKVEDPITPNDAATIAARASGYNLSNELEAKTKVILLKGINPQGNFTVKTAMEVLWNALNLDVIMQSNDENYINNGTTILEELFHITKISGIVNADGIIDVNNGISSLNENQIAIDGVIYETDGEVPTGYSGLYVDAYIYKNDYVVCVTPKRNTVEVLDLHNVDSLKSGELKYNDAKDKIRISNTAKTLLNFERMYIPGSGYPLPKSGYVVLIDNNNDSYADYIFIYTPQYALAREYNSVDNKIYAQGEEQIYELAEYENVKICDASGNIIRASTIESNSVLEVYADSEMENIVIFTNKESVEIKVSSVSQTEEKTVIEGDDGTVYEVSAGFSKIGGSDELALGKKYSVLLDLRGRIVYACEIYDDDLKYGYIYDFEPERSGVQVGIYSIDKKLLELGVADKIRVTQENTTVSMKKKELLNLFESNFKDGLIRFGMDSEGKLNKIVYPSSDEFSNGFRQLGKTVSDTSGNMMYSARAKYGSVNLLGGQIMFDISATKIMVIPDDFNDEESWDVLSVGECIVNGKYYQQAKGYGVLADSMLSEVIVIPNFVLENTYTDSESLRPAIVSGFRYAIDQDTDETYTIMQAYSGGKKVSYAFKAGETPQYTTTSGVTIAIETGDIVRLTLNRNDKVETIKLLYDESTATPYGYKDAQDNHTNFGFDYKQRSNFGQANKIVGNVLYMLKQGEDTPSSDMFRTDVCTIYEYDKNSSDKVRVISKYEIGTLENNPALNDKLFVQLSSSTPMIMVVYKQ